MRRLNSPGFRSGASHSIMVRVMSPQRKSLRNNFVRCLSALLLVVACDQVGNSPGKTVQAFYTAIEHRNYDEAMSYVAARDSGVADAKIRAAFSAQREESKDPAKEFEVRILKDTVMGDSAHVEISQRDSTHRESYSLVKENGRWKLVF